MFYSKYFSKQFTILFYSILLITNTSLIQASSLLKVYQLAVDTDPSVQQAQYTLLNSQESIIQAHSTLLPAIDGQLRASWNSNSTATNTDLKSYTVNLTQAIYDPVLNATLKKANNVERQAKLILAQTEQTLILRSVVAYVNAMIATNNLTTDQARERSFRKSLDRAKSEFDVGIIAMTDVHEAQASYDNAHVDLIISEGRLENSLEVLQRLTGKYISDTYKLALDYPIALLSPNEPKHWVEKATTQNLTIVLGKRDIEASVFDTQIASSSRQPTVNLQAFHTRDDDNFTDNQIALTLTVPFYSGGSISSKIRQSISLQDIAKSKQLDSIRNIAQQTQSTVRDVQTNVLAIKARQQSILSSSSALIAIKEGYNVGTRNITDLLNAEQNLFSAKNDYENARLQHVVLLFTLKKLLGSLSADDVIVLNRWMIATD
ncbi:TolC family outer membrane protein [Gammaproteobacteria bacterium AS21]